MNTLFEIHSGLRWLILLLAALALIRLAVGLFAAQAYDRAATLLMRLLAAAIGIQMLIGLIYLIWNGIDADYWPTGRFIHAIVMFVAGYVVGDLPRRWRDAPPVTRYRNDLVVVIVALVIIFVGISALPGGNTGRWDM